ncbi:MAG: HEPN domain-containing protein [Oscillospiraceae bacterium]|nr:HEPN domain-containing protein [Oscillospiraceae bacterium]
MRETDKLSLSKARLALAKERLGYAKQILELGDYKTVANRSYYAVFSAMRAVLALDGFDSKKHSGVIAEFRRKYLKTEILPRELSPIIRDLVDVRQGSDYDDFYLISRDEVAQQLVKAEEFVSIVEQYLTTVYAKSTP